MSIVSDETLQKFKDEGLLEDDSLSLAQFNLLLGVLLLYGFLINAGECYLLSRFSKVFPDFGLGYTSLLVYIVFALIGMFLIRKKAGSISLFLGYNCFVLPIGFSVWLVTSGAFLQDIYEAALLTSFITVTMCVGGTLFPQFFIRLERFLFFSLLSFIIAEFVAIFFLGFISNIWNIIAVGLFSLYIGFDWAVAMARPRTIKNVLRSAIDLYLDIINIFLSLLRSRK